MNKLILSVNEGEKFIIVDVVDDVNNIDELNGWVKSKLDDDLDGDDVIDVMGDVGGYIIEDEVLEGFEVEEVSSEDFINKGVVSLYKLMMGIGDREENIKNSL